MAILLRDTKIIDQIQVEVDELNQYKFMRWDDEVNFALQTEKEVGTKVIQEGSIVKYVSLNHEVHLYDKPDASEDGGFEIEWVLLKPPMTNVLTAAIQSKGLDFFYQPPLTVQEINDGAMRPPNVIGSYAVYHKTKTGHQLGAKNYRTGKAFHIYRPQAIDALGVRVWCKLHIDEVSGILTVTVPQTFLDLATYPVIVDPTFGYTSVGASVVSVSVSDSWCHILSGEQYTASAGDIITSYSAHLRWGSSMDMTAYSFSGGVPVTRVGTPGTLTGNGDGNWYWINSGAVSHALTGGNVYVCAMGPATGTLSIKYDSVTNAISKDSSANLPSTWAESSKAVYKLSMYATYTAGGGGLSIPVAMNQYRQRWA